MSLDQASLLVELFKPPFQFLLDALDRLIEGGPRRHVMAVGVDLHEFQIGILRAGERIELLDFLDLVAEQGDAPRAILQMRREEIDHIAPHTEAAAHTKSPSARLYCSATRSARSWR